jgi:putative membrane protein
MGENSMIKQFINGICMALADSVPGVSGGTIAFILGFYDKFIGSINDIFYERGDKRKEAMVFLLKLGIGWATGMVAAILVISNAFEQHIYLTSSLFLGFIIASIPIVVREEKSALMEKKSNLLFCLTGALLVIFITAFNNTSFLTGVNLSNLNIFLAIYIFVSGMIAISAMFLPGISGSSLLLIFGLYLPVMNALNECLHFNLSYLPGILIFAAGIVTGAFTVVKGLKICLDQHRSKTMYSIIGLMIGSLYAVIQGPTTLDVPLPEMSINTFHLLAFTVGVALVTVLHLTGRKKSEMLRNI